MLKTSESASEIKTAHVAILLHFFVGWDDFDESTPPFQILQCKQNKKKYVFFVFEDVVSER